MNARQFVNSIRITVQQGAARGVIASLKKPADRKPNPEHVQLSEWFHRLESADQDNLCSVVNLATDLATYNFLAVLDGLAAIEPVGPKGSLALFFDKNGKRVLLNDPQFEQLTFLFKELNADQK